MSAREKPAGYRMLHLALWYLEGEVRAVSTREGPLDPSPKKSKDFWTKGQGWESGEERRGGNSMCKSKEVQENLNS